MQEHQGSSDYASMRSQSPSINSQSYAIPIPQDIVDQLSEGSTEGNDNSESDESSEDILLNNVVHETSNGLFMDSQDPSPMLDVSKYIFDSLVQAIDSADFAEAISVQTKTSAVINSKSLELRQLIDSTRVQMVQFKDRFQRGIETSRRIRQNLQYSKEKIDKINAEIGTAYPIEMSQAKERVLERHFDELSEEEASP